MTGKPGGAPGPVAVPAAWVESFLECTQLGGWIAVRAGRFRVPAGSRLHCELEILCRFEALGRPMPAELETQLLEQLASAEPLQYPQAGLLSADGSFRPLMGGRPALPGTAAVIDLLKEAAACVALQPFLLNNTLQRPQAALAPAADHSDTSSALPACMEFACRYNRETAPDEPFRFLDLLLRVPSAQVASVPELHGLLKAARAELCLPDGRMRTEPAGHSGPELGADSRSARQLYGIAAHCTAKRPALIQGVVCHVSPRLLSEHPGPPGSGTGLSPVLVWQGYRPEYEEWLSQAGLDQVAAIVEEEAGRLSPGALMARRHGLPCVNGLGGVTSLLSEGTEVFVDQRQGILTVPSQ